MKPSWGAFGAVALLSCGGSTQKSNLVFYVDPPGDGDVGCIGVAGFEVDVTAAGKSSPSGPLPNNAPVLDADSCHLSKPFSIQDLDVESPASVVVTGHDGAGIARVQATGHVDNLRAGSARLQLKTTPTPPLPVLVVYRAPLLNGAAISDITRLAVTAMGGGSPTLVDVGPGAYSSVEPAPYGVSSSGLAAGGADSGKVIFIDVTTTQGVQPRARRNAVWNTNGYYVAQ
jgi:hypothetical protein